MFVGLFVLCANAAEAEMRYITDEFTVTMRRGENATFKVVRILKTGMEVELLESGKTGWDRVRTRDGSEGWVLRRFLSGDVPARVQLFKSNKQLRAAEEERDRLREEIKALKVDLRDQNKLQTELDRIRKVSRNALTLEQGNKEMAQRLEVMEENLNRVTNQKMILEQQSDRSFLVAGAAILVLGMVIGFILTRSRGRKRYHNSLN
ncbi:MAG: TIGR04211 family SH3 domain-containing protein [Magnetococcales bacterium]|nr:TIGR04211 family SH3 domain-containing protein [Magnetococcales bacterium]